MPESTGSQTKQCLHTRGCSCKVGLTITLTKCKETILKGIEGDLKNVKITLPTHFYVRFWSLILSIGLFYPKLIQAMKTKVSLEEALLSSCFVNNPSCWLILPSIQRPLNIQMTQIINPRINVSLLLTEGLICSKETRKHVTPADFSYVLM